VGQEHEHQIALCRREQSGPEGRESDNVVQKGTEWARKRASITLYRRAQSGPETRASNSVVQKGKEWARYTSIRWRFAESHRVGQKDGNLITLCRRAQNGP
jgi:hypothetical protein